MRLTLTAGRREVGGGKVKITSLTGDKKSKPNFFRFNSLLRGVYTARYARGLMSKSEKQ
jgi:hypothetical protein